MPALDTFAIAQRLLVAAAAIGMFVTVASDAKACQHDRRPRQERPAPERMERMQQRIEDIRKVKLLDVLNLDGTQVERFFGVYNSLQAKVHQAKQSLDKAADALGQANRDNVSADVLTERTNAVLAATSALHAAIDARNAGVRAVLTVEQYARYVVFEARFLEELQRKILKRAHDRFEE